MTAQIDFNRVQFLQEVKRALGKSQELLRVLESSDRHPLKHEMWIEIKELIVIYSIIV